jgi:succinyl-CoA synthetase beta subunit
MDLFEYQGKQLFAVGGIPVTRSQLAKTAEAAIEAGAEVGFPLAVKAQVLTGGRGRAGGVKLAHDERELLGAVRSIIGMTIKGKRVDAVLLEKAIPIAREYYLAITLDRPAKRPLLMFSTQGGIDIEQVARKDPAALRRVHIDPLLGLQDYQIRDLAIWVGLTGDEQRAFAAVLHALWRLYLDKDATLIEINPLVRIEGNPAALSAAQGERRRRGRATDWPDDVPVLFVALDAKVTIDNNALFRHPEFKRMQGVDDIRERRAREAGFAYVALDGDIGVLGNGAGLVMSILDLIHDAGGKAANFLDVGGGAREAQIAAALDIVLSDGRVEVLLVTIFGGITRCDEVARGLLVALEHSGTRLPVVARLTGTNAKEGQRILADAEVSNLHAAGSIAEAVKKAVAVVAAQRETLGK